MQVYVVVYTALPQQERFWTYANFKGVKGIFPAC